MFGGNAHAAEATVTAVATSSYGLGYIAAAYLLVYLALVPVSPLQVLQVLL